MENEERSDNPYEFFLYRQLKFSEKAKHDTTERVYGVIYLMPPAGADIQYSFGEGGTSIDVAFTAPKVFWGDLMLSSWQTPSDIRTAFENKYVKGLLDIFPADPDSKSFTIDIGEPIQECPHIPAEVLGGKQQGWCYHAIPFMYKEGSPTLLLHNNSTD